MENSHQELDPITMKREAKRIKLTIAIVGAGPSGLVLGLLLRRSGHETVILDREEGAHRPVCGEYLSPQGVAVMESLDLNSTLEGFPEVNGMQLVSPAGRRVEAPFPEQRVGVALNRRVLQERLMGAYLASGGVLLLGESLVSLKEEDDGVKVISSKREIQCDALVGADGRSSAVAKLMGWKVESSKNPRVAIHAYLRPKKSLQNFGQMHILPDHSYAGINPVGEDESNFSIVTDVSRLQDFASAKDFLNFQIRESLYLSELFDPIGEEKVKTTFPIRCQRNTIHSSRVVLIGDASGFIDPLTGEGITTGIKTAMLLANALESEDRLVDALANYARRRKTEYKQKENLNWALQAVIRMPWLCEWIALALGWQKINRLFIGVIGNIYTPWEAAKNIFKMGESLYGKNSIRAVGLSETQLFPEGSSNPAAKSMARPCSCARPAGKNIGSA